MKEMNKILTTNLMMKINSFELLFKISQTKFYIFLKHKIFKIKAKFLYIT